MIFGFMLKKSLVAMCCCVYLRVRSLTSKIFKLRQIMPLITVALDKVIKFLLSALFLNMSSSRIYLHWGRSWHIPWKGDRGR